MVNASRDRTVSVPFGTIEVQRVTDRIQAMQGKKKPVLQQRPEKKSQPPWPG